MYDILPDDYIPDECIPRKSCDKTVNEYGKKLFESCKSTGMRIVNGRCGEDNAVDKFTCVNSQGCSELTMY